MTPKAVVFDIGNVLIEWQPERFYDAQIGEERRRAMFAEIDLHGMNDRVDTGENFTKVIRETAAIYPHWADEIMLWHDNWIEMAAPAIPHSERLMDALQAKGIPVFSLTNFGVETMVIARKKYGFLHKFDRDFISGHMQVIKPAARIYELLEEGTGLSGPELLFTDDRHDNINAAKDRNWQTHLFEYPQGWADKLVASGLLTEQEAV
ncbi:HAD-IA family hydrolase [Sulfitobacter donghicola]|uniref:Haloacid dehalogenase n=1 Tax=Sulfitobacter donghicola DSW-25 = KCTC 12864 = JCM 14565 TaxID=1300350 RepID=A0A073IJI0_9RHOB|nr:HAD-IA family hydrolase [Sulfitobacter donghicola]KEJ90468.1 haloacid dehalogenase [Sulfitobacter donghicola DSW-25 = KCTC 12864 = JCM 14565]KIN67706.1 HAD-superfamily hydrolase, subfamily IA, variant 1 family protein [Sulfitobacter donghicola DSW-25 = KCTC 12864 = JCM 14565]